MADAMNHFLPYPWQLDNWDAITQQINANRFPHALLVSGEQGCGKRHFVDSLVRKLLCTAEEDFACGECKACQLMAAGSHPGFLDIGLEEKSKLIKVDQVRVLVDFMAKTVQIGHLKVAIIEPAEQLNLSAANALLKCLEEPAGNSLIVLVTHAPNRLLPTIRSRCQTIAMRKPGKNVADKWLSTFIADEQNRHQLMLLSNDNPLLALQYGDREVPELYRSIVRQLSQLVNSSESITKEAEWVEKNMDGNLVLWIELQQKIVWQLIRSSLQIQLLPAELNVFSGLIVQKNFLPHAYKLLEEIQQCIKEWQGNSNPNAQLLIESLLLRWQWLLGK